MRRRALLLLLLAGLGATAALAHPLAPALLRIQPLPDGQYEMLWRTLASGRGAEELQPEIPSGCTAQGEPAKERRDGDVVTRWVLACGPEGLVGSEVGVRGLAGARGDVLVFITLANGDALRQVLTPSQPRWRLPGEQTRPAVAVAYGKLGLEHILGGFDHLLFVLGLVLLVAPWRRLLWTVTGFTLGHSVTLALAVLGWVQLPSRFTEAAIAFSIFWLAVELARPGTSLLKRFPAAMAAAFGLLHGLGFAGALAEVGLPKGDVPLALGAFNVGIELGQIAFVVGALALGAVLRRLPLPAWARLLPMYLIGTLGFYWFLERALGLA